MHFFLALYARHYAFLLDVLCEIHESSFDYFELIKKAAGLFEDAGQLHAARAHIVNVCLGVFVPVFKGALLLGLTSEHFIIPVGVERRVYVNEVNAGVGQFGELFQIVAAIDNAGVEQRGGFGGTSCSVGPVARWREPQACRSTNRYTGKRFRAGSLFCHARD